MFVNVFVLPDAVIVYIGTLVAVDAMVTYVGVVEP